LVPVSILESETSYKSGGNEKSYVKQTGEVGFLYEVTVSSEVIARSLSRARPASSDRVGAWEGGLFLLIN
jgi:hypothetical protein